MPAGMGPLAIHGQRCHAGSQSVHSDRNRSNKAVDWLGCDWNHLGHVCAALACRNTAFERVDIHNRFHIGARGLAAARVERL